MIPLVTSAAAATPPHASDPQASLQVGDIIDGKIASVAANGIAHIEVAGRITLAVRSSALLTAGEDIKLTVRDIGPAGPVLELSQFGASAGTAVQHSAAMSFSATPSLSTLQGLNAWMATGRADQTGFAEAARTHTSSANADPPRTSPGQASQTAEEAPAPASSDRLETGRSETKEQRHGPLTDAGGDAQASSSLVPTNTAAAARALATAPSLTQASTSIIQIPLPGTREMIEVYVTNDEERTSGSRSRPPAKETKATFSISLEALGHVRATLRQSAGTVSIHLLAEQTELATELNQDRNELATTMREAGILVERIEITGPAQQALTAARAQRGPDA